MDDIHRNYITLLEYENKRIKSENVRLLEDLKQERLNCVNQRDVSETNAGLNNGSPYNVVLKPYYSDINMLDPRRKALIEASIRGYISARLGVVSDGTSKPIIPLALQADFIDWFGKEHGAPVKLTGTFSSTATMVPETHRSWLSVLRDAYPDIEVHSKHRLFFQSYQRSHDIVGLSVKSKQGTPTLAVPKNLERDFIRQFESTFFDPHGNDRDSDGDSDDETYSAPTKRKSSQSEQLAWPPVKRRRATANPATEVTKYWTDIGRAWDGLWFSGLTSEQRATLRDQVKAVLLESGRLPEQGLRVPTALVEKVKETMKCTKESWACMDVRLPSEVVGESGVASGSVVQ